MINYSYIVDVLVCVSVSDLPWTVTDPDWNVKNVRMMRCVVCWWISPTKWICVLIAMLCVYVVDITERALIHHHRHHHHDSHLSVAVAVDVVTYTLLTLSTARDSLPQQPASSAGTRMATRPAFYCWSEFNPSFSSTSSSSCSSFNFV